MYRKVKKIPTILALLLIMFGLGAGLYLDGTYQQFFTSASPPVAPSDIHLTNISDNSITVSYITEKPETGAVILTLNGKQTTHLDDIDNDWITKSRLTHMFTLKNLMPDTFYNIKIVSGKSSCRNTACPEFTQKTGVKLDSPLELPPITGRLVDNKNDPTEEGLIYLLIGKASPLSARTDGKGIFAIPLNNLRSQDFLKRPDLDDNSPIQITFKKSPSSYASVISRLGLVKNDPSLEDIELGKTYNFLNAEESGAESGRPAVLGNRSSRLNPTGPTPTIIKKGVELFFPEKNLDTTIDNNPKFRGAGIPGDTLKITVKSKIQTANIIVGSDGTWEFRPKEPLEPGSHEITVEGKDINGKKVSVTRKFVVFKSGEQILGESTPSGDLTPTETPDITPTETPDISITISPTPQLSPTYTPTPTPSETPTPSQTPTPTDEGEVAVTDIPPRAGTTGMTNAILISSLAILFYGIRMLLVNL
ncbi:hypothetical protein A3D05_05220 [Candidatus Gottesmanbacteria bacterium RIFCSPHIGHO2_02_FULL_40_24]|uniref:Fibronectin type-III domain-containing protein n=1 Tax=Candidatus Gottesmanbacteria bacterium RIFCSPHIGHO2_01_FULL_40_15 TaxID=1798376 RepID=A0A1F5Z6Q4_9BACT|nr:MAG: hypothetical protein A2777_01855 [Candidatus Gottesmanbacteria bacterium RIFCSPHIGHO2_01_FULL_40_15]OGG16432.1 MAG: hypothetical protein A3D05_05220 [Candidatus Gottesmanbacteria bacterium RIFCSPHIGHO2_02_FULL_40_24]OGG22714.1 MAG: hypothetical protein A3B48_02850 [Candidatus Gottesmanbacteria bacterium RIFCSPLOWO2_01_FULL_40_10]OGG25546.1 MAG: hypothetical protein A3E42_04370 [Candidatus Gottesmanbacteria bacterium RIFCSPHIGHO2_12_FULL_40_13]OGG32554.1 MAG: hypothetical protein A3I80_0